MGFKFTDCASQDISRRICCSSLLLMYFWQSLLICFVSLSCMSTNLWATNCVLDGIVAVCCDNWYDPIHSSPGEIPNFAIGTLPSTITEPPPFFMVGVIKGLQLFHQVFVTHWPTYLTQTFQILIYQSKGLYSTALLSSLCAPWPTEVFWHCFASFYSGFLAAILSYRPASESFPYSGCWFIFFMTLVQLCSDVLEQSAFYHTSWWLWWNYPLHR